MRKKAFMRRVALLVSLLMLMTSTIQTTYGFIVVVTDPVINTFKPEEVLSGDLTITKRVEHKLGEGYMVPADGVFEFEVDLGEEYKNSGLQIAGCMNPGHFEADEKGVLKECIKLQAGQTAAIYGELDEGTVVTVKEILPADSPYTPQGGDAQTVTITPAGAAMEFVNIYDPGSVPSVRVPVTVTKVMSYGPDAGSFDPAGRFSFVLKNVDTGAEVSAVLGDDSTAEFWLEFTEADAGRQYTFTLSEVDNGIADVVYDTEPRTFTVDVVAPAGAGQAPTVKINGSDTAVSYSAVFNNTYNGTGSVGPVTPQGSVLVDVTKIVDNIGSESRGPGGFVMLLEGFEDAAAQQEQQQLVQGPVTEDGESALQPEEPAEGDGAEGEGTQGEEGDGTPGEGTQGDGPQPPAEGEGTQAEGTEPGDEGQQPEQSEQPGEEPAQGEEPETPAVPEQSEQPGEEPEQSAEGESAETGDFAEGEEPTEPTEPVPAVLGWSDGLGDGSTPYSLEAVYRQERETSDAGKAVFQLDYTSADVGKTYYYKLSEIAGNVAHMTYDGSVYEFTVTVSEDADGKLVTEVDGAAGNTYRVSFTNTYNYTPEDPGPVTPVEPDVPDSASVPLIVTKSVVETGEVKLGLEGWEFVLDSVESGKKIVRTTDKSGQANFFLYFSEYDLGKTFNYILTETAPEGAVNRIADNVLYDGTVHQIQVEVVRSKYGVLETKVTIDGQLSEEYFQKLRFTNVELSGVEDVTLKVKAHKTMKNTGDEKLGPEEFKIILKRVDADGKKIGKTMSDRTSKKGNVTFQLPAYTIDDIGQTFRYQIYEKDEGKQNVTYDETVHEFAVQVSLTEDLKLQASLMLPLSVAEKYAKDTDNEKLLEAVRGMKGAAAGSSGKDGQSGESAAAETAAAEALWVDMTDYGWKAEFTNIFHCVKADVPKTGDDSDVDFWFTMMILSLISTIALFAAERRYCRKAFKAKR